MHVPTCFISPFLGILRFYIRQFDTILNHTNISWLWRSGVNQGIGRLDEHGLSLLHIAAQSDDVEVIEELIQKGIGKKYSKSNYASTNISDW